MDTRAPFDDAGWPESPQMAPPPRPDQLERRLAAIEDRLASLEGSLRTEIAEDLDAVSHEMRRAVSELGRLLLRDLDRLTRLLGEHRDAIVDRLLMEVSAPEAEAEAAPEPGPPDPTDPTDEVAPVGIETAALRGEDGRWRVPRRRRARSPKATRNGDTGGG